jgi:hypothetical protein
MKKESLMHEEEKNIDIFPTATKEKRVNSRKIGKCTYIVSSSFKEGKEHDIISTFIRLIQNENTIKPSA